MRLRPLVGLLAATLLVSGCGESPEPKPMPKPSDTATSSSSPSPPVMPAAAKGTTDAAVGAFVRHYIAVLNYATVTGDTQQLQILSAARCKACDRLIRQITSVYRDGGSIESEGWKVVTVDVVSNQPDKRKYVDLLVNQSPQRVQRSSDAKVQTFPGGRQPMTMLAGRSSKGWILTDLRIVT